MKDALSSSFECWSLFLLMVIPHLNTGFMLISVSRRVLNKLGGLCLDSFIELRGEERGRSDFGCIQNSCL
jgi:hypothetical protein